MRMPAVWKVRIPQDTDIQWCQHLVIICSSLTRVQGAASLCHTINTASDRLVFHYNLTTLNAVSNINKFVNVRKAFVKIMICVWKWKKARNVFEISRCALTLMVQAAVVHISVVQNMQKSHMPCNPPSKCLCSIWSETSCT